jgi:hypothetical protein
LYLRVLLDWISRENGGDPRYTPLMPRRFLVLIFALATIAFAQDAPKPQQQAPKAQQNSPAPTPLDVSKPQEFITAQFGADFVYLDKYPVITGDLDGDGNEDAILVTTRKDNPLLDEDQFHYKVIDPYDEYFGWGDPRVTSTFNAHDPSVIKYVLIVEDWHASTPKAKLVVINLPFEKLSMTRIPTKNKKRKVAPALLAEDLGGIASAIYWDGKKYRWSSMSGMD